MGRRRRKKVENLFADLVQVIAPLVLIFLFVNPRGSQKVVELMPVLLKYGTPLAVAIYATYLLYFWYAKKQKIYSTPSIGTTKPDKQIPKDIPPFPAAGESNPPPSPTQPEKPFPQKWSSELIHALEWKRFEELCSGYFEATGYIPKMTRTGADGGIDICLYRVDSQKPIAIVQCKAWNTYRVGVKPVRELYGVMAAELVHGGVFMTSGNFTEEAKSFSEGKRIKLINGATLLNLIESLPDEKKQVLLEKITAGDYTTPTCPSCGIKMVLRTVNKGNDREKKFWGCSNYPRCKHSFKCKALVN